MKLPRALLFALPVFLLAMTNANAQTTAPSDAAKSTPEEGIPVTDPLVLSKCGGCHVKDSHGNLSRISWERATPEQWEEALKRMIRLNGVTLAPAEAKAIIKYLGTYHGLAPEEAKPVMYIAEKRILDETSIPNDTIRGACANCHPLGRPLSWRRSVEDWKLLANLHVALYPQADEAFRLGINAGGFGDHEKPGDVLPVDTALEFLGKTAPLHTPEWAAWRARMRAPKLAGRWLVSANILGHGKYYGELEIEPGAADDEFTTRVKLVSVKDGSTLVRSGRSLVYAGYSWRGHSKGTTPAGSAPDDLSSEMREVMWFSPDQTQAEGRWFWGQYQEFGFDVKLQRAGADATILGADKSALKTGTQGNRVRILGENLPPQVAVADLDLGSGVTVKRILSHTANDVVAEVDVASDAVPGKRDIAIRRTVLQSGIAIYDKVDYIKVIPESVLARLGSQTHPKGYQQFEAIGYQRGADGKLHTADDVELGPVDVTWSVQEFYAVYGDDDKDFVGTLSATGLFTPASDGPNPKRKFMRNNYGDVWIVATSKTDKGADGKLLMGKSYLVVTVPMYMNWDQPEVGGQ